MAEQDSTRVVLDWRVARRSAAAEALAWRAAALEGSLAVAEDRAAGSEARVVRWVRWESWRHWDLGEGEVLFLQRRGGDLSLSEESSPRARAELAAVRRRRGRSWNFMVVVCRGWRGDCRWGLCHDR